MCGEKRATNCVWILCVSSFCHTILHSWKCFVLYCRLCFHSFEAFIPPPSPPCIFCCLEPLKPLHPRFRSFIVTALRVGMAKSLKWKLRKKASAFWLATDDKGNQYAPLKMLSHESPKKYINYVYNNITEMSSLHHIKMSAIWWAPLWKCHHISNHSGSTHTTNA